MIHRTMSAFFIGQKNTPRKILVLDRIFKKIVYLPFIAR